MTSYMNDLLAVLDEASENEDLYDYVNLLQDLLKETECRLSDLNRGLNPYEKYSPL